VRTIRSPGLVFSLGWAVLFLVGDFCCCGGQGSGLAVADRPIATPAGRRYWSQYRADQDAHRRTEHLDLAGLALGLSFEEVRERFDEIVDFGHW
jgi:hypothetical protein